MMRRWIGKLVLAIALQAMAASAFAEKNPSCAFRSRTDKAGAGTIVSNLAGKGDPVLLIHGLFANKEQWNEVLCRIADSGRTAIAIDLPGYGKSMGFTLPEYELSRQVDLLHYVTKRLKLDRIDIAGNSMGGAIAALYANRYPKQVRSLAFIGAPLGIVPWSRTVKEAIDRGANPFIPIDERQLDIELDLLYVKPPSIAPDERRRIVQNYATNNARYVQIWNIVNLYDGALVGLPPAKQVPTLILWGENDKVFGVAGAQKLAGNYPGSELRRLARAGHLPQVENAAEVAALYTDFLQKVPPPPDAAALVASGAAQTRSVFACVEGKTIDATITGDQDGIVQLVLSDGRNLTLPRVKSRRGSRYASDAKGVTFWTLNNEAFIEERGQMTFEGCRSQP